MSKITDQLNSELLEQPFSEANIETNNLSAYKKIACNYAKFENAIAVLSDMKLNKSYIYYGGLAVHLGITSVLSHQEINSIWEEKIFSHFHPDDLTKKYQLELQYFHFLKTKHPLLRTDYQISSIIRMSKKDGSFVNVRHRMFYLPDKNEDSFRMSVCLYNALPESHNYAAGELDTYIINTTSGKTILPEKNKNSFYITQRETAILKLIRDGKSSKEIAQELSISIYTVSRHRQNILEKLHARNSLEACRIAERIKLI